jgi:hypothetical protein
MKVKKNTITSKEPVITLIVAKTRVNPNWHQQPAYLRFEGINVGLKVSTNVYNRCRAGGQTGVLNW